MPATTDKPAARQWPHDLAEAEAQSAEVRCFWKPSPAICAAVDEVMIEAGREPMGADRAAAVLRLSQAFVGGFRAGVQAAVYGDPDQQSRDMIDYAGAVRALSEAALPMARAA